ncbi:MAG: VOC family protein, partial [Nitrospinaceae bacterium]|nr:VOC family protein [Nitrospinaceae bacterium]
MGCNVGSLGHIGVQVSDMDRSLKFYREVVGLKLTGRWGPPDFPGQICFMRVDQMHHNFVLFGLPEGADNPPSVGIDSTQRHDVGLNHVAFEVDDREDWL